MSGSTIGGIVGGVVGFFFGVPQLGYVLGAAIGGAIDPEEIQGPKIGDAQRQTSMAGVPRPVVYGHPAPFMGNLIDGEAKARKIEQTEGGKGGPEVTTERFILTSAIRICEGPVAGFLKIWRNDQLVLDRTADADFPDWANSTPEEQAAYIASIRAKSNAFNGKIAMYYGEETQLPDPTLEAIHGVGNTPYYRGTAYIVIKDDDVTDMRGAAAQWKFEVLSVATEGTAPTVTPDVSPLPNAGYSAGGLGITTSTAPLVPQIADGVRLAQIRAQNFDAVVTYAGRPRAPRAGLFDDNRYCPGRVVLTDSSGTIYFDSGWMGDPIQQTDLDAELTAAGMPLAQITPISQLRNITFPPHIPPLLATFYVAGFGLVAPTVGSGSPQINVAYPDPALLPPSYTISPEFPDALLGSDGNLYYPSWVTPPTLTTLSPGDVFLPDVILDVAQRCKVPAANIDVAELAGKIIPGFLVAQQGPGADVMLPTQQGFFYDFPEYDKKMRAILRGHAAVTAITEDDLLDVGNDEQTRPQQVEYPRLVSVITQDPAASYAPIPQTSIRTSLEVVATNEVTLPLAIPFGADDSKQIAEKLHKVLWAQAEGRIELPLPEKFSTLTPSDCFTYAGSRWLIERTDYADGEMLIHAAYDRASAYESSATGQPATPPELPSSGLGGSTLLEFLNLPILSDLDDRLGFYVAVSGELPGWRGAQIQARIRDSDPWTVMTTATTASVMGSLLTALPNAPFDVMDVTNTVRVDVNGALVSITLEQLLNEGNGCVIGDEICQFQDAAFVSDGVYDLSTLTRGRLDTATASHAIGTRFVLLNAPVFIEAPSSWIGQFVQIRAVTLGTVGDDNQSITVLWSPARSQTEWAPVQFIGNRDTSNNVTLSWVGQGRLGSNKEARNSQFFDNYRVRITKGSVTVTYLTTAQNLTYSASQQTLDFGSATGTLTINIAAMNRITGPSAELTGSVP